jgi:PAS domain S-box-containing protein
MSNIGNAKVAGAAVGDPPSSAALKTSSTDDKLFRLLFENSLDAIIIADDDGVFLDVNQPACNLFGYSREQMLRMRIGDLMTAEAPDALERYKRYIETGREAGEFAFIHTDGQMRIASYSACRLAPGRHLSILRDLTMQRRAQEAAAAELAQQAHLFDTVLSSMADFAYVFDREGRITYVNQALLNLWQRELAGVLGKNFFELDYPPALAARLQEQIQCVFDTGQTLRDETPYTGATGTTGYYEYIFVPVLNTQGLVEAVAGSTRDITARHREQKEKETLLHALEVERARLRRAMIETHHRVKNNLQMMAAFIDMQRLSGAEIVPMSEMVRLGQNIQALGVIHDILTKEAKVDGDVECISVKGVLDIFLPLLQSTLGERRLFTEIEELFLSGKQVTSLTLIANELISNAVKYGNGDVKLTLETKGGSATLEVYDDGAGFPEGFDPATAAHTGLELIENIVHHDLQGEVSYQNRTQGGARVAITFPVKEGRFDRTP